jgi:hypothetical protein
MWSKNMVALVSGLFLVSRSIGICSFYRSGQSNFVIVSSNYDQNNLIEIRYVENI